MPTSRKSKGERPYCLSILVGGQSSRLGTDKGLFRPLGDESLIIRMIRLLGERPRTIQIVLRNERQKALYEVELTARLPKERLAKIVFVTDEEALGDTVTHASLLGVYSALKATTQTLLVIIPVDQVAVRQKDIERLVNSQTPACFQTDDGLVPFPSVWHSTQADTVRHYMAEAMFSVRAALKQLQVIALRADTALAERLDTNVNTLDDMSAFFGAPLFDRFDRRLHYLRLSLTESCNMSCTYCLPDGFPEWYRHKARMQRPELETILRAFRRLGFRKVRFTGGEPTVHPHALDAVRFANRIGFEEVSLTTNGLLIKGIDDWVDAGLTSINISIDSLDAQTFEDMTKSKEHKRVLDLIERCAWSGLTTKVNTVLLRSKNAHEAPALIDWAMTKPITLRFIELMPTGLNQAFHTAERVSGEEIEALLKQRGFTRIAHGSEVHMRGPATVYQHPAKPGKIGLINPMSCNFCDACNRLRVTAQAKLRLCLFGKEDLPLDLSSPAALEAQMRGLISKKEERHHLNDANWGNVATFRTIGG